MTDMTIRALLFDIGEVVTTEQWHLLDQVERTTGRTLIGRGPLDPTGDPVWQRYLGGELSFTDYWAEYALANGYDDWRSLFRDLPFETDAGGGDPNGFVHPEAARLIRDARSAGLRIGALTNDGVGINGMQFFLSIPLLAEFEVFADAQEFGGKPAPEAYLNAARQLGLAPAEIIFLDDTPYCVDGARDVGMPAMLVDPMDRAVAFDEVRRRAGIGDVGTAQRLVDRVTEGFRTDDVDALVRLLDPTVSIHLNGTRVALGTDEARTFLTDALGAGDLSRARRRLRAASGHTLAVEHESPGTVAAEFWTLRRGLIIEWQLFRPADRPTGD